MTVMFEFLTNDDGATMIEYALIAALVAMGALTGLQALGTAVIQSYEDTAAAFPGN